jgi:hypothetical protein
MDVIYYAALGVAAIGVVMLCGFLISKGIQRIWRIPQDTLDDPGYRRWDTSGVSLGVHWLKPGLLALGCGIAVAALAGIFR